VTLPGDNGVKSVSANEAANFSPGFRLLLHSALRYALTRRWQTVLNILGIMVGVMMVVAVDLANNSARQAFDSSLELLNGQITHQIYAGSSGIPDNVFRRLKTELGLQRAAPSLSGQVRINNRQLTLLGIDVISEGAMQRSRPGLPDQAFSVTGNFIAAIGSTDSVVMETNLAQSLGLAVGDVFNISTFRNTQGSSRQANLAAVFTSPNAEFTGELILADIAAAQYFLQRPGSLDAIDLVLDEENISQLQSWLPPGLILVEANSRNDNLRQMSEAFHINLLAMSLLSLLVAGLLIYNTVTLSVIQRQQTLGIFRAIGVSRRQIFSLVMLENGAIGLLASILGVSAGFVLGSYLVTMVTATVDNLYLNLAVTNFFVDPAVLLKGLVLGMLLSLVSSVLPAIHAARSIPVTLQHQAAKDSEWQNKIHLLALPGIILLVMGWALLLPEYGSLLSGFIALTLMVFGFCLLVPVFLYWMLTVLLLLAGKWAGLPGVMALRNARSAINRTGLAVAALCVAVSVTVGVGVMVGSFRGTVILWLDQSLPGDLQVSAVSADMQTPVFPENMLDELAGVEGLLSMHYSTLEQVESEYGPLRLGANDIPAAERFYLKEVSSGGLADLDAGRGVFISEPLSYLQEIQLNDSIRLLTQNGLEDFPVLGIFYDYTSGYGLVQMHDSLYDRHWSQRNVMRLTLDIDNEFDEDTVLKSVRDIVDKQSRQFNLVSNRQLRELTLQIFDRTFAITNVLRLLAILVAFVGVVSTLMALQLEKFREFAILRATGMTPIQIVSLILKQTTVLGVCAGLLALPLGLLMSDILIDVINRRSFGWSMQHFLPESVLMEAFALAVIAALLAGIYPAWRATRIRPVLALREE
jgi:putative ABC transport system permease protein